MSIDEVAFQARRVSAAEVEGFEHGPDNSPGRSATHGISYRTLGFNKGPNGVCNSYVNQV